jgi:hypothetical protein
MSTAIGMLPLVAVLAFAWCWLSERTQRCREAADYEARLSAAFSGLREYQQANDTLRFEVRRREQSIATLLQRLNEATIAKVAGGQRRACPPFVLGLPHLKVAPSQFSRN